MSHQRLAQRAALLTVLSAFLAACLGDSSAQQPNAASDLQQPAAPAAQAVSASSESVARTLPDFAPLVEKYGPAVVNVEVVQQIRTRGPRIPPDDPFYEFFRRFGIPGPEGFDRRGEIPARGAGSGFIVTPDGYILTNAHVVANADEVIVRLTDRREFQAKVIGIDERTDVAVIKIDAKNLPTVRIGDPSKLKPGEWVLAIGSPFGFENSATAGIVSATSRALPSDNYVPFIQTDVAVNPGNSGGPLFNMRGEVVGINSQIFSRTGGYMGLSFAIPIDVATHVQEQLIRTGRVVRGRIGVTIQDVNAQLAESFGLDRPRGALVASVENDGPADKAGIQPGDVILSVNGKPIEQYGELSGEISRMKPGSQAQLQVWRNGRQREITVRVGELQEQPSRFASRAGGAEADEAAKLGLAVRPLAPEEKERIQTQGNIIVEDVSGPAAVAGVQPGDIILGVNGKRINSVEELRELAKSAGKSVALLIQRGENQIFVPLRVG